MGINKKLKKKVTFWIMTGLIALSAILLSIGFGNEQIIYGLFAGLVTGFFYTILSWITR